MHAEPLMRIHSPEFRAMSERVLQVTALTTRLNVLPFDDETEKAELFARRRCPAGEPGGGDEGHRAPPLVRARR